MQKASDVNRRMATEEDSYQQDDQLRHLQRMINTEEKNRPLNIDELD